MTSKERVIKTINHEEPDRVPVGEFAVDHDHVEKIIGHHTYWRNRKDTTLALWEGRRDEVVESLKNDCVELVEKLDYDIVTVELVPPRNFICPDPPKKVTEGVWEDSKGSIYKYAASNDSIQCMTYSEGKEELTEEDILEAYNIVESIDESIFELVDFIGDRYGREKAVVFRNIDIYEGLMDPFGGDYNHQLILTSLAPDEIKRLYAPVLEYNKKLIEHCKNHNVLIAMHGQDFGMNTGCIISPSSLRSIYFPFMEMVNNEIIKAGMIPFYHCCGKIWDILDDYTAARYKGYQSVQQSAGMDWEKLKKDYGNKLTIWAGVQCETLINGTLKETEDEVTKAMEILMPGGGFIFGSTNSVQYGAKTENYLKALYVVRTKGVY